MSSNGKMAAFQVVHASSTLAIRTHMLCSKHSGCWYSATINCMQKKTKKSGSQYVVGGKTHYERNREKYIKKTADRRSSIIKHIRGIKETSSCVDCGISDWRVLDFDHIPDKGKKMFKISNASTRGLSIEKINKEITKCEPVCANCHRIRTFLRNMSDLLQKA